MQRKQQIDYVTVLTAIRALRQNIHPASIMCDFEIGFPNAARQVFGNNVVIVGCLLHLGQCVYRKVLRLGLSEQYMQDEDVRLKCKMLVSLAFIPAVDVIAAMMTWNLCTTTLRTRGLDGLLGVVVREGIIYSLSIHDRITEGLPKNE